ncbi:NADPH-dependent FMN reductase [Aestuariivirga litoralis]|uniref:NADPH-dependent FMN reductase n=1 Tax=Aestuariivirga litoralis TaxID=2650924 RepID=UPI0018C79B1C|nr:NADPH-dependent FMN reductase [Aestuariivirga litoralis]MBG1232857.1 NAD(P)H-dependent oxidoreductase [Aestuariivirga litoralis]
MSGSLRTGSTNTALLEAARLLAPSGVSITLWNGQGALPQFNPDLESAVPTVVQEFRDLVGTADGLLIACPEYARGLPGAFKNALDWLVGGETFVRKPFVQWNASPRASEAQKSLRLVLETMSGIHIDEAALALPLIKQEVTAESIAAHPEWAPQIRDALAAFIARLQTPAP